MSPDEWKRVQRLFHDALDRPPEVRAEFLDNTCEDPDLRAQVDALLEADEGEAKRLDVPITGDLEADARPGTSIGPYAIRKEIGRGGMGRVFLAEREDVGSRVALKLVRSAMAAPEHVERFLVERRILARLEHPNIARLLDAGVTPDDTPFFAMEYVEGETITAYCDRRQLSVNERLELFATVGQAVAHAHQNLVVHRDLKPSNVFVSEDGRVKLLDFGIAKMLDADAPGLTATGRNVMTPGYAAPEQVRGEAITTATDVYAMGVVLYELLTGLRPHSDESSGPYEMERNVLETDPRPPSEVVGTATRGRASGAATVTDASQDSKKTGTDATGTDATGTDATGTDATGADATGTTDIATARSTTVANLRRALRGDIDTIVLKALRREPDRRYDSAAQFVDDIRRVLDGRPVSARPDTFRYRARTLVRRHKLGVGAAVAVLLSLVIGLGAAIWQGQRARAAQAEAEAAREQVEEELAKSEAVTGFLVDLFQASDPEENIGLDLTARTLLQRGEERVDTLTEQPLVRAELQNVIGQVYTDLGDYERADRLLMKSLTTRREASGDTREVADALFNLGVLRWRQSNFAEAEIVFREAYDIRKELYGTELHPDVAGALNALALSISKQGRLTEAVPMQERMMEISPQLEESEQWQAMSMNNLAVLYQNLERYGQAAPLAEEMLAFQQGLHDAPHPQIAMGLTNLGSILTDALRAEEAIPHLREALAMRKTIYDADHPEIASAYHNLAEATFRAGQMEAADSLFGVAIEKKATALGTDHAGYGDVLQDYGLYLRDAGQRERARDTLTVALQVRESIAGANLTRVARTLAAIASLDLAEETAASARDAESRLRRAASIFAERFDEPHPFSYVIRSRLGRALLLQQRYDAAEPELRAAYRGLEGVTGAPSLDRPATADALATLYAATGQPEYAETWRARR